MQLFYICVIPVYPWGYINVSSSRIPGYMRHRQFTLDIRVVYTRQLLTYKLLSREI